ncbi:MAG: YbjQ family protein [Bacteroidota bacterium]|nr:YbjQ family protein [Bacteroidota bacterium]
MLITNTETISGREIDLTIGLVKGSTVRARNIGRDIFAGLKTIIGGEITGYTKLLNDSREEALKRLIKEAESLKADAVVNLRFTTSTVMDGCSEILAYGTAVKLK